MNIKEFIVQQNVKQLAVAKAIAIDPSRLSKYLNEWQSLPKKYWKPLSKFLNISLEEIELGQINLKNKGKSK